MKKITYLTLPLALAIVPLALFIFLSTPTPASAAACSVPADQPTIQAAVNDVSCDIINPDPAIYAENVIIDRSLSIIGTDPTTTKVDGTGSGSVFHIMPGVTVTIESLSVINGAATDGAGIFNDRSNLTISNTIFIGNVASSDGGALNNYNGETAVINSDLRGNDASSGAGIYSNNILEVTNTTISSNDATAFGGGIYNTIGTVDLTDVVVMGNTAGMGGGGLYNLNGAVSIDSSEFRGNQALLVNGGAIYQAYISATLTINNSIFDSNTAEKDGGGVYSSGGNTTINNSTFASNEAIENGGGLVNETIGTMAVNGTTFISNTANFGAGMYTTGTVTIAQSLFQANKAADFLLTSGGGGGLQNEGNATIETSQFIDNVAFSSGGGILNTTNGTLIVRTTTVDDNNTMSGFGTGGGIANIASLKVEDSTISNNAAIDGGGLYNLGIMTVHNSTVSGNNANGGGGIQNLAPATISFSTIVDNDALVGGGILALNGPISLNSSIIALNPTGDDCATTGGTITSQDYNLDSDNTCNLVQVNDLPATAPNIGPLQANGGWTQTHALLAGSPAIDNGDNGTCPGADQRGFPRPFGSSCDIGAFEAGNLILMPAVFKS